MAVIKIGPRWGQLSPHRCAAPRALPDGKIGPLPLSFFEVSRRQKFYCLSNAVQLIRCPRWTCFDAPISHNR